MKVYRQHGCSSIHRTYNRLARCMIRRVAWVSGEGPYALIAWCRVPTVTLYETPERAHAALEALGACGGHCTRRHEVVALVRPHEAVQRK